MSAVGLLLHRLLTCALCCLPTADLDAALNCLTHEDPSLRVTTDPDTGQVRTATKGGLTGICRHLSVFAVCMTLDYSECFCCISNSISC